MAGISSCEKDFVGKNPTATTPSNQHTTTQVVSRNEFVKEFPSLIGGGEGPETLAARPGRDYIISEYGLLFLRGNYRSFTFRVTNTPEGGYMENLVFSQHGENPIRVFLVEYDLNEVEMEKISDGEAIDLTGKVAGITSWESATHQGYAYQSWGEEEPCQIGFAMDIKSYCKKGNHPNGRKDDGSKCPLYAEITTYYFEDCGGAGDSGPLIDDNPFTDYPPGIEFPETGGGVDGPDDDNIFEDDEVETQPVVNLTKIKECKDINEFLNNNPDFKTKMQDLASPANLDLDYEQAAGMFEGDTSIEEWQGNPGEFVSNITWTSGEKFIVFFHNHPDISPSTLSIFSIHDLVFYARLIRLNSINADKFIAFLATKKGTYYALTITDPQKLLDLLYNRTVTKAELLAGTNVDMMKYINADQNDEYYKKYFDPANPNSLIKKTDTDNENVLKHFLGFMEEADAGIMLFETDENFTNFQRVKLKSNGDIKRKGCGIIEID